jgi:hypothetical protein
MLASILHTTENVITSPLKKAFFFISCQIPKKSKHEGKIILPDSGICYGLRNNLISYGEEPFSLGDHEVKNAIERLKKMPPLIFGEKKVKTVPVTKRERDTLLQDIILYAQVMKKGSLKN